MSRINVTLQSARDMDGRRIVLDNDEWQTLLNIAAANGYILGQDRVLGAVDARLLAKAIRKGPKALPASNQRFTTRQSFEVDHGTVDDVALLLEEGSTLISLKERT